MFKVVGLGEMLGYPLMTVIGTLLVNLASDHEEFATLLASAINVHIGTLTALYNEQFEGYGGLGLIAILSKAVRRVLAYEKKAAPEPRNMAKIG